MWVANSSEKERRARRWNCPLTDAEGRELGSASAEVLAPPRSETDVELELRGLTGRPAMGSRRSATLHGEGSPRWGRRRRDACRLPDGRVSRGRTAFYLNDKPVRLRGLNRHQTFPYIGQAAPARAPATRRRHPEARTGLQHRPDEPLSPIAPISSTDATRSASLSSRRSRDGDTSATRDWKELSVRDVEAMIVRDRNHPCVCLWGVRINESADDHDFYERTNALARYLDPTRQTGGVRCRYDSEFLEDVFTMNDFRYDLRPRREKTLSDHRIFAATCFPTKNVRPGGTRPGTRLAPCPYSQRRGKD